MIKTKIIIYITLLPINLIFSQNYFYSLSFGNFSNATSFHINPQGFLFVIDQSNNEIIKLDTLGNLIKTIGGYGWDNLSFDSPEDIFTNTLNIYVADKNNDRIQIFDKDLNYLSSFVSRSTIDENTTFRYPTSVGVSNQGDFFILDSDNARILKFGFDGKFLTTIGGLDAGTFSLRNPKKFAISSDSRIITLDNNQLVIFDQFGNNISKLDLYSKPVNINSTLFGLTVVYDDKIDVSINPNILDFVTFRLESQLNFKDALIYNTKLYILTSDSILVYNSIPN